MDAKQTACYHCKTLLSLPKEHSKYWRCGHCRKVNGRPNYARSFVPGFLYCGLCRFYFSRITNAIATTALVGIVGSGLLFFLPMISRDYAWPLWLLAWTVSVLLSVMATATFRRAATSTPGAVPRCAKDEWARRLRAVAPATDRAALAPERLPWCDVCNNLKPPRTHHCSTCSVCVDKMDHHCAFLHNCVGADNLSDFVVFLFSVCAGTWFVVIYAVFELIATYSWRGGGDLGKDELNRFIRSSRFSPGVVSTMSVFRQSAATRDGGLILIAAVSLGIALGVGILLWIYASLAKTGETNLEKSAREYRKGPDFRTYPGWTGVFAGMKRRRGLTDAAIVAELRQTGYFDNPPLADEGAVSKTNGSVARRRGGGEGANGDATEEAAAAGEKSE